MKSIILVFLCCWIFAFSFAQQGNIDKEVKLKELAVPKSPAFKLLDISPTQIETPNNPKQFALGVAQSFNDSLGWPRNYSTEFAPYWWLKSSNRSVYDFLGLKTDTIRLASGQIGKKVVGQNPFAGLKFTSISLAFVNQDMIPDAVKQSQKILSVGLQSTLIKVHHKKYGEKMSAAIDEWHNAAQNELDAALDNQPSDTASEAVKEAFWQKYTDMKPTATTKIFEKINEIMNEKPLFNVNVGAAYANYGINDSIWKTGRLGIWTTVSSYLPLSLDDEEANKNYFSIFGYFRYLKDNYAPDLNKKTIKSSALDIGAKVELQFDRFCIGYEIIHRKYSKQVVSTDNRNVGVISYQISNNLYINGAFGKDFGITNKLISFLGINWGFGDEKIKLE